HGVSERPTESIQGGPRSKSSWPGERAQMVPRAGALLIGLRHDQVAAGLISLARNLSISPAIRHPTGEAVAFHRMLSRYRAGAPKSMPFISASTASSSLPTMN